MVDTMEAAIQSVLAQNDPDFEHIVVDGGSTDGTLDVLEKHSHLIVRSEPGSGQVQAMNQGFELSSGEIISYLNADDTYEEGAFQHIRKCFLDDSELKFLVGRLHVNVEGSGEWISEPNLEFKKMLRYFNRDFIPLNPASYFYRREVQESIGGYDRNHPYSMDYRFLLEAALKYELRPTDKVLGRYRVHENCKTARTSSDKDAWLKCRFSTSYYKHLPLLERLLANVWYFTEGHYFARRLFGRVAGKIRRILGRVKRKFS
jgi:glycosyltransferase involved in cell wall biosynthesis